jgi:hypothetical protein
MQEGNADSQQSSGRPQPRHWYWPAVVWHREWLLPRFTRWDDKFPTFSPVRTLDLGPMTLTWWGGGR